MLLGPLATGEAVLSVKFSKTAKTEWVGLLASAPSMMPIIWMSHLLILFSKSFNFPVISYALRERIIWFLKCYEPLRHLAEGFFHISLSIRCLWMHTELSFSTFSVSRSQRTLMLLAKRRCHCLFLCACFLLELKYGPWKPGTLCTVLHALFPTDIGISFTCYLVFSALLHSLTGHLRMDQSQHHSKGDQLYVLWGWLNFL